MKTRSATAKKTAKIPAKKSTGKKSPVKLAAKNTPLKNLPEWDLGDFYASPDAPQLTKDFNRLEKLCTEFSKDYDGKVTALTGEGLARAIREYEVLQELFGK